MHRVLKVVSPRNSHSICVSTARPYVSLAGSAITSFRKPVDVDQRRHGSSMNVILLANVSNRGSKGEVVQVKRGYARNLLIPKKMAGVCSVLFSSILSPVASSRSNFFQTIEELPIQDFISAIKGTILNYFRHFFAYATPENKIKHEVIIAHRAYLIEQGIVEEDDVTVPNISIVPQLAHIVESQVIAFVRPVQGGDKTVLTSPVTAQDIQNYLKEGGYEVTSLGNITVPMVNNIGLYSMTIGDTKCILQVIAEISLKVEEKK